MRLKQGKVQVLMSAFPFGCQIWKRLVKKPVKGICVLKQLPVSTKCRSSRKTANDINSGCVIWWKRNFVKNDSICDRNSVN